VLKVHTPPADKSDHATDVDIFEPVSYAKGKAHAMDERVCGKVQVNRSICPPLICMVLRSRSILWIIENTRCHTSPGSWCMKVAHLELRDMVFALVCDYSMAVNFVSENHDKTNSVVCLTYL
jgi:hypothetical protein